MSTLPSQFIWIDLEMTGLDPLKDRILEIAFLLTDKDLNITAYGPRFVIHQSENILGQMDSWCKNQHQSSGLLEEVRKSTTDLATAEQEVLSFIAQHIEPKKGFLCGNSIWVDRMFLRMQMPKLEAYLHYRMIDVSTIKELITAWYPANSLIPYKKQDQHRAMQDILESIEELRFYKKNFFIEI